MGHALKALFCALIAMAPIAAAAETDDCAEDPRRSGVARTIAISPADGARFGRMQYSQTAPLRDREVVLTFDDGPLGSHTSRILDTLDRHCAKGTFFAVGRMAIANPGVLRSIARRGHTVATHTWSHQKDISLIPFEEAKLEIEKGFAAISHTLGGPIAPFFRYPGLNDSPELNAYLATRNISVWSVDVVSGDTNPGMTAEKIVEDTMNRLRRMGRGILLFHDIKPATAEAMDEILVRLKIEGYKIVHTVSNTAYLPDHELLAKINFRESVSTVAFTGRPLRPEAPVDVSAIAGPVDYVKTEQILLDGETAARIAKKPPARKAIPARETASPAGQVTGNDILLSTGASSSAVTERLKSKPNAQ